MVAGGSLAEFVEQNSDGFLRFAQFRHSFLDLRAETHKLDQHFTRLQIEIALCSPKLLVAKSLEEEKKMRRKEKQKHVILS